MIRRPNGVLTARVAPVLALVVMLVSLTACDDSSASTTPASAPSPPPSVNNVQPVVVDAGPNFNGQPIGDNDILFTSVTICIPGTTTCQTIDHIQVDTGATGLRILASQLTLALPGSTDAGNNLIGNCVQYADNTYQWGPVAKADIQMAGEKASSVPIQVVGATNFPAAPSDCNAGGTPLQTVQDLAANGILGLGLFRQDCGPACASPTSAPPVYYSCPAAGCTATSLSIAAQLQNPVWMFSSDNNGLVILLPQIGASGQVSVTGSMIFGIGTQSNNALNGAAVQGADGFGNFMTTFKGATYTNSFLDTGSNGLFFLDAATVALPDCPTQSITPGFYCPASPVSFTAITTGPNPLNTRLQTSVNIAFSIANAVTLISSPNTAFNNLGGDNPGMFDWGLPFFFGRNVFIGIEGQSTPGGVGPFWAF